jgi:hypothetical protein
VGRQESGRSACTKSLRSVICQAIPGWDTMSLPGNSGKVGAA